MKRTRETVNTIDTHTHFYDPARDGGVPWPSPRDEELYRTVLPDEFVALAEPLGITGTIVVEASSWLEDNAWILELAADNPVIVGFVGNLDVEDPRFSDHLARFAPHRLYCGIRLETSAVRSDDIDRVVGRLDELQDRDLALDLIVGAADLTAAAGLASRVPGLRIILNHVGGASIDGGKPDPEWVAGMKCMADCSNVSCKVSGMVEGAVIRPAPAEIEYYRPTLEVLWRLFGPQRLIFGNNWPVSASAAMYETVFRITHDYFEAMGDEALRRVFRENALAVYRCIDR